jgi:hypothetical protein
LPSATYANTVELALTVTGSLKYIMNDGLLIWVPDDALTGLVSEMVGADVSGVTTVHETPVAKSAVEAVL